MMLLTTSFVKYNLIALATFSFISSQFSSFMNLGLLNLPLNALYNSCWRSISLILLCHVEKSLSTLNFAISFFTMDNFLSPSIVRSTAKNLYPSISRTCRLVLVVGDKSFHKNNICANKSNKCETQHTVNQEE